MAAAVSCPRQRKTTSAPAASASSFVTKDGSSPFSLGSRLEAGCPARESEPRATGSSSGCASRRSRVSWPVYPAQPRIAAVAMGEYYARENEFMQIPFEYLAHLVTIPVTAAGTEARFVFDS